MPERANVGRPDQGSNLLRGNAITIRGVHVNADVAMGWYLGMDGLPPQELAAKFMAGIDPDIPGRTRAGDILVCGRNFGFGKVHSSLWTAMKTIGISCIVAESFATPIIQYGIAQGIRLVECAKILDRVSMGDAIEVDVAKAVVWNRSSGRVLLGQDFPRFLIDVMEAGGHQRYLAAKVGRRKAINPNGPKV